MNKTIRATLSIFLCFTLLFGGIFSAEEAFAAASSPYVNIALGKSVSATVTDGEYRASNVVDGVKSPESKWQAKMGGANPVITLDLGAEEEVSQINLVWDLSFALKFKMYIAGSNQNYKETLFMEEGTGGTFEYMPESAIRIRYVKVELIEANNGNAFIGLQELEVLQLEKTDVEPVNLALHRPAAASGVEINSPRLQPAGAFDGQWGTYEKNDSENFRWSSGNITEKPQWIYVDLGGKQRIGSVNIYWEGPNDQGKGTYATDYKIQYSSDGVSDDDWKDLAAVTAGDGGWDKHTFEPVEARYVRMYATKGANFGVNKAICMWEMQVFAEANDHEMTVEEVVAQIKEHPPVIGPDDTEMPIYRFSNGNITAKVFSSDTDFVVSDNGSITKPLIDKKVLITYVVKDHRTGQEAEVRNIPIIIPGRLIAGGGDNPMPKTVPSLQEWKGAAGGLFALTPASHIIVSDAEREELYSAAEITKADIMDLFGLDVDISNRAPQSGDIVLTTSGADAAIGDQGYTLKVENYVTISATAYKGVFFGTRSVLQALVSDGSLHIAKGIARDYPKYEIRKFMLDVGRKYHPMWFLEDFVKYASWLKYSDIQIHINDTSYNGHSRFRLESDIPGLAAADGHYTKEEYRDFQHYAEKYGIRIITEFDTPAHSAVFIDLMPELAFDATHLDIRLNSDKKNSVYQFIADLYDEYLGGNDPVIVTDAFNVGLDEFNANYKEDMTQYTKYVFELIHDKYGKTPMAWASMGSLDTAATKLPKYPIMDAWANYAVNLQSLFDQGYKLVNGTNKFGYIVPGGNNGYPDFADEENMYNTLSAGYFRDKNGAGITVAEGHPQIVGGMVSLWNDRGIFNGISLYDVFARQQSIMPIYSQTFWYGREEGEDYASFKEKVNQLGIGPSLHNLDKTIDSDGELVYQFEMESVKMQDGQLVLKDSSPNGYAAKAVNGRITPGTDGNRLTFAGDGYLEMPHPALQWPYTAAFDLEIDEAQKGDVTLFMETLPAEAWDVNHNSQYKESAIRLKESNGSYQLVYDREGYHYEHSYLFEKGKPYQIAFTSDKKYSKLYVNGKLVSAINGPILTNSGSKWYDSASINLPLQQVAAGLYGSIDRFYLYNYQLSDKEIEELQGSASKENLAYRKNVTVSSLDPRANGTQNGPNAVDGDPSTRWTSDRVNGYDLHEYFIIDLGDEYQVDQVEVDWEDASGREYTVQLSVDGSNFTTAASVTDGKVAEKRVISFESARARYVKLDFTKKTSNVYGYSIYEVRVFENHHAELLRAVLSMRENAAQLGDEIDSSAKEAFLARLTELEALAKGNDPMTEEKLVELKTEMLAAFKRLKATKAETETVLTGPTAVSGDQTFTVNMGLNYVKNPAYALDISLTYDADRFEFMTADSIMDGVEIVGLRQEADGKLRLIVASGGADYAIVDDAQLLAFAFRARTAAQNAEGSIAVTNIVLGDAQGNEYTGKNSIINIEVTSVNPGIKEDINGDGKVSIGDLAIVAAAYGKTSADADWEAVKRADLNGDGFIDLQDLVAVALKIVDE